MKRLIVSILISCFFLSAAAQDTDTTSTVVGEKLNFEQPRILVSDYFEGVKMHLSAEGRKEWRPEFSLRYNLMIYKGSVDLTAGIRTSSNKVFGICVGLNNTFYDAIPADASGLHFCLYHRHYIPLDRRRRFSLYSDLMGGGSYIYKVSAAREHPGLPQQGTLRWWYSWQPGISIRLWGKSNIFFGPTLGPSIGAHLGIAI